MKLALYRGEGQIIGKVEVPDDVVAAASRLEAWLRTQPTPVAIYGIGILEQHFPINTRGEKS